MYLESVGYSCPANPVLLLHVPALQLQEQLLLARVLRGPHQLPDGLGVAHPDRGVAVRQSGDQGRQQLAGVGLEVQRALVGQLVYHEGGPALGHQPRRASSSSS